VSARAETLAWAAQRLSAAVLAVAVTVHLVTLVNAVRGGLTGHEIVARVSMHDGWLAFYAVFVAAAALHAGIGVRGLVREAAPAPLGRAAGLLAGAAFATVTLWMGLRAVLALYGASAL